MSHSSARGEAGASGLGTLAVIFVVIAVLAGIVLFVRNRNGTGGLANGPIGGLFGNSGATTISVTPTDADVEYCNGQAMDIYEPAGSARKPAPAVVYVHGGGWHTGDKRQDVVNPETGKPLLSGWITALQAKGFVVAAINYRLAPQDPFPAPIEDVKCSVRFLRANARRYGIDANRIGALGGSSGGQLVSLLGTAGRDAGWDGGAYANESSAVQAVVDLFGPADIPRFAQEHPNAQRGLQVIFGPADRFSTYSPIEYVGHGDPPTLIVQGTKDTLNPQAQSEDFYRKLRSAGVPTQLVLVKNAGHLLLPSPPGSKLSPSPSKIQDDIVNWFVKYLG